VAGLSLAAALLALPLAPLAAQQAEEPPLIAPFGAEILVNEVLLDVLVTDKKGAVILGLGPQDFKVTVDGKPMEVTSAQFYSHRVPMAIAPPSAAAAAPPQDGAAPPVAKPAITADRYFVFFFDDQRYRGADAPDLLNRQVGAGRDVKKFLRESRNPSDWVAVVAYDHRLRLVTDFTRDLATLEHAVDLATLGRPDRGNWPSRRTVDPDTPSLGRGLPAGDELRDQTRTVYEGITLVAEAAGRFPGRKNLLLFTQGFGQMNRFRQYEPDPKYYEPMSESLNDSNTAVYTFDLTRPGTHHPFADAMNHVATDTGGRYYSDVYDFGPPLDLVQKETSGYYLVAFSTTHPKGLRGFQPVEVRLANPELRVTARRGYRYGED
jgi:VWFA-related protein